MSKTYYTYIMTNKRNGTLYVGTTNNLERRVFEHKSHLIKGFSSKYDTRMLVYYEYTNDVSVAIQREKQLKEWKRAWKIKLIEKDNPNWDDLPLR